MRQTVGSTAFGSFLATGLLLLAPARSVAQSFPDEPAYGPGYGPQPPSSPDSQAARQDDTLSLSVGAFVYNWGLGAGTIGGLYLDPDIIAELDFYGGTAMFPDDRKTKALGLGIRYFVGNSFYIRAGLRYRDYTTDNYWVVEIVEVLLSDSNQYAHVRDLGIDVALGNRWQFSAFTLGVDWFGVYQPAVILEAENVFEDRDTGAEVARQPADKSDARRRWDLRILYLQLGASF